MSGRARDDGDAVDGDGVAGDGVQALRTAQDRDVRLVGVPMFVVLRDETVTQPGHRNDPASGDADGDGDGDGGDVPAAEADLLVARLDDLRARLAPSQRDGDLGVVASLLGLAAHLDFGDAGPAR